jgi:hypothetical protein
LPLRKTPPPPHHFSNGPSLTAGLNEIVAGDVILCLKLNDESKNLKTSYYSYSF